MAEHFHGLDGKRTCGRCQKQLRDDEKRTHVISIYGVPRNEDICNHCFSVMHQRVHMKCCSSCGSIQKASIQCPICQEDTGE
jgi:hypothetical protein